jgi:hypothetical protein
LQQIAKGLRISAEALYVQAGILEDRRPDSGVRAAVLADPELTERQKQVLLEIYESFRREVVVSVIDGTGPDGTELTGTELTGLELTGPEVTGTEAGGAGPDGAEPGKPGWVPGAPDGVANGTDGPPGAAGTVPGPVDPAQTGTRG